MNAVRELVRNAVRHSGAGSMIRVLVGAPHHEQAAIVVEDDGPGVPTGERLAIFAPFTQGRARCDQGAGGLGLGLAIAKRSVEALGGTLTVDDSPEGGARFTILVPMAQTLR